MCRGEGWASKYWPVDKGHVTFHECADYCGGLKGCRAFDVSDMIGQLLTLLLLLLLDNRNVVSNFVLGHKLRCWLYHHDKVKPASSVPGKCFSVKGVKDKHKKRAAKAAKHYLLREEVQELKRQALRPKEDHQMVGSGMCRGPKWASKHWPQDLGSRGVHGCFKACQKSPGCTAFDVVSKSKRQVSNSTKCCTCLLYGHTRIIPASHAAPRPAECHKMVDHEPEDEVDPRHIQGQVRVKVIGEGACR